MAQQTPKEKAEEIYIKCYEANELPFKKHFRAKIFALIVVNEILAFIEDDREIFSWKTYYQEVKQEIEKL